MKSLTPLYIALGIAAGWLYGDQFRRRKYSELHTEELTNFLDKISRKTPPPETQLNKIALILKDAHKHIHAVSKALLEPAS